jgi:hypothetical protein
VKVSVESLDASIEVRITVSKGKQETLEMFVFLPSEMNISGRKLEAERFLEQKASRYHYSISKPRFSLLKQKKHTINSHIDFPMYLKALKLKLSKMIVNDDKNRSRTDDILASAERMLRELRDTPTSNATIKDYRICDELCTYSVEQILLGYAFKKEIYKLSASEEEAILAFIVKQRRYRRNFYGISSNEPQSMIRKERHFCKSINILQKMKKLGMIRDQIAFSLSAFLSMAITTLIVFNVQIGYGNLSFALFVALCISYIFKDRFKELFRNYVAKKLSKGKYQYEYKLADSRGKEIAKCRDLADFCKPDEEIMSIREKGKFRKKDSDESVILYKKKYEVSRHLLSGFSQFRDTMVLNLDDFLKLLPDKPVKHHSLDDGKITQRNSSLIHDLNIIFRYNGDKFSRYRLKVCHSGLSKIEQVTP